MRIATERNFRASLLALFAAFLWLGAGCQTRHAGERPAASAPPSWLERFGSLLGRPLAPSAEPSPLPVDALALYGEGLSYELDGKNDLALESFRKAALKDPSYDALVTEVARRLLLGAETDQAIELLLRATERPSASGTDFGWLSVAYSQYGREDLAAAANATALKKAAGDLGSYRKLAEVYLINNKAGQALDVMDQAALSAGENAAHLIDLADLYQQLARMTSESTNLQVVSGKMEAALKRAMALQPADPGLLQRLGDGLYLVGDNKDSAEVYERLLKLTPETPLLRQKLLDIYLQLHDDAKVEEQLQAIAQEDPGNAQTFLALAAMAEDQKKMEQVTQYLEKVIALLPDLETIYFELAKDYLDLEPPKAKEALGVLEKARNRFPNSFSLEIWTATAYEMDRKADEAVAHLLSAEKLAADQEPERLDPDFYCEIVRAYLVAEKPKFKEALDILDRAKGRFGNRFIFEFYTAAIFEAQEDFKQAVAHLMMAENLARSMNEPDRLNANFYFRLGAAEERSGDINTAASYFRMALQLDPNDDATLNYLGYMWADHGMNLEEAKTMIERAVASKPKDSAYLDSMAWVLFKMNQGQEALKYMLQAIANLEEPDDTIYEHLGDIEASLKDYEKARDAWTKSLKVKANPEIQKKIDALPAASAATP